jgi:hypothetical protein
MVDSRAPTHLAGQHGRSTQYERAILAERRASASRATFTIMQVTALCVLPLAVIPWAANKIVVSIIGEPLVSFHINVSGMLSIATAAFALWQFLTKSERAPNLRKWLLVGYAGCAVAFSVTTSIAMWRSWSQAVAEPPQRAFEYAERCGKGCRRPVYQARNGRIIGTDELKPLPPYGPACVSVSEVVGSRGLRWARVVERSRRMERGQLYWPIRREDCFSDKPLASLPR